jgi:hypothetical protein
LFNTGHKRGGSTDRIIGGRRRRSNLFGPLSIAAIGALPATHMSRSRVINMRRQPPNSRKKRLSTIWFSSQCTDMQA